MHCILLWRRNLIKILYELVLGSLPDTIQSLSYIILQKRIIINNSLKIEDIKINQNSVRFYHYVNFFILFYKSSSVFCYTNYISFFSDFFNIFLEPLLLLTVLSSFESNFDYNPKGIVFFYFSYYSTLIYEGFIF